MQYNKKSFKTANLSLSRNDSLPRNIHDVNNKVVSHRDSLTSNHFRALKKNKKVWVGLLNYKHSDLACDFFAIPFDKLTNVRLISPKSSYHLIGLEEQLDLTSSYYVGLFKGVEYILTFPIKIAERRIWLPYKHNIYKKGIKLQLKGRLRGVSKANSFKVSSGNVRTHTFDNAIDYCEKPLQTKWGIFGLKIFLN
jgi:hypothetical protein